MTVPSNRLSFSSVEAPPGASSTLPPLTPVSPGSPVSPLLPRYQRLLSFGALLDETFRLYRRAWLQFMLALVFSAVPVGLLSALLGHMSWETTLSAAELDPVAALRPYAGLYGTSSVVGLLTTVLSMPAFAAVTQLADAQMRGRQLPVLRAYWYGVRATPVLVLSSLLSVLAILLLSILAIVLFVVTLFGVLGGLVALIALIVWWGNPRLRRPWVRALILVTTPFGLPLYVGVRWTLALPLVVLERLGPVQALRRSARLTRGQWFRVFGLDMILGIAVNVLQMIPGLITGLLLGLAGVLGVASGAIVADTAGRFASLIVVANAAAGTLGMILFGALPMIGLTLLYQDTRNRWEGADLAERLAHLEATDHPDLPPPAGQLAPAVS